MFYGRVDVYWPDKPVESYRLNKETIAVGRSTGNDIILDTTTISRYHITLTFRNQQALLEDLDSANGTYVDSVRLHPNTPMPLRGGEEIQIGEVRMIFHPPAALERSASEDTTQRVMLSQPTYRIELDGPDMAVAPGAHVQAILRIENLGEAPDRYFIEIDGLPKGWARADRVEAPLDPGEETQVIISFKPLRRSESLPGEHPLIVRVRSTSRPAEAIDIPTVLHVLPYSGFGMALGDSRTASDGNFKLYLHNQGNAPLPLAIQGTDKAQALRIAVAGHQVRLGPGERRTLSGTVTPRRPRWFGSDRHHEFAIVAHAQDSSGFLAAVPGRYTEKSKLPAWVPALVVPVIALMALLTVGLGLWLLSRDSGSAAAPVIQSFSLDKPDSALGDPVIATWSITGAEAITLYVRDSHGQQQYALERGSSSYTLMFDETGTYTLMLEARNDDTTSVVTAEAMVRPKITLSLEVLGGAELMRNVQHDVVIHWSVVGAKEFEGGYNITLESSDHDGVLLSAPQPLTGDYAMSLVPDSDSSEWLVTITAEGDERVTASMTQRLSVIYPVCELVAEQTVVYAGPGEDYPVILSPQPVDLASGGVLSYSPVARDPSGEWLYVMLNADNANLGWVRLADFACTNFDPARLLITADYPLPPEATPTGTANAASTPTPVPTVTTAPLSG